MSHEKHWWRSGFFTEDLMPIIFGPSRLASANEEVGWILSETGAPRGASVLDVACGIGRHSTILAKKGYVVDGIDTSKKYVQHARERSRRQKNKPSFFRREMNDLSPWNESVDLCINLFSSIGYYETRAMNSRVISGFAKTLRPGGSIVIDTVFREGVERLLLPKDWSLFNGGVLLEERKLDSRRGRLDCTWTILDGKGKRIKEFQIYLFSKAEFKEILQKAGIHRIRFFGSLTGDPLTKESFHLVMVGQKR